MLRLLPTVLLLTLPGCATWKRFACEGWGRDRWQQPERVIEALSIENDTRVADIGAGGGYFTFRLAQAVAPLGTVYAVDIDPDMTNYLRERVAEEKLQNVEIILASATDPGLPADGVDLLFTCDTYHHFDDPVGYFRHARRYLRSGGRVAIIDLNGNGWFSWLFGHSTSSEKMRADMLEAGYEVAGEPAFLADQNFVIFVVAH